MASELPGTLHQRASSQTQLRRFRVRLSDREARICPLIQQLRDSEASTHSRPQFERLSVRWKQETEDGRRCGQATGDQIKGHLRRSFQGAFQDLSMVLEGWFEL